MLRNLFSLDDKDFYRRIFAITLPIAFQNLINFGVSMMDTLMVGYLGEVQLSAAAAANQLSFMFMVISFGIANGCAVLSAQHWGKKNREEIAKIMAFMFIIVFCVSTLFVFVGYTFPEFILRLFIPDQEVIAQGVIYLKIVCFSYFFSGITNAGIGLLRSVGTVKVSIAVYSVSLVVNTTLNYILIFGKLGFPAMGMAGAAIATLISRIAEVIIVIIFIFKYENKICFKLGYFKKIDSTVVKNAIKYSLPVVCNEILWTSGALTVSSIIGHMGREVLAANSICSVLFQLSQAVIFGLSNSATTITGNTVGGGNYKLAQSRARSFIAIAVVMGLFSCSVMYIARFPLIGFYENSLSALAIQYAYDMSLVASFMAIFQTISLVLMMGVLRGGGDTKFVMIADVIFMWIVSIPLGAYVGLVLHAPITIAYFCLKCEDILKCLTASVRIVRGKWLKDITI